MARVLIVEDERINRITLADALEREQFEVVPVETAEEGLRALERREFDVAIVDLRLPGMDGLEFLKKLREVQPECQAIVTTAYGTIENAVEAMKLGAYDFVTKPFSPEELVFRLKRGGEFRELKEKVRDLQKQLEKRHSFHALLGKSPTMQKVFDLIERVAQTPSNVLIVGESGTGKEMVARAIHFSGPRKDRPFVALSLAAIPENLMESELFGFRAGAFTDAKKDKPGKVELASLGTLFLDDIDAAPLTIQPKLLRVLQERQVERLGSNSPRSVDIRVLAACKPGIEEQVQEGTFREDLYYRLCVVKIQLPPLRERKEDIPLLAEHFLKEYAPSVNPSAKRFSKEALDRLTGYDFPGNVRQLEHIVEHALHFSEGEVVSAESLPEEVFRKREDGEGLPQLDENFSLPEYEEEVERHYLSLALQRTSYNFSEAARLLKIPRSTLQEKAKKLGLSESQN